MVDVLCIVQDSRLESSIGASPYYNQFFEAFEKLGLRLDVFHTVGYERVRDQQKPSLFKKALNKVKPKECAPYFKDIAEKYKTTHPKLILLMGNVEYILPENLRYLRTSFPEARILYYDMEAPLNFPEYMTDSRYGNSPWASLKSKVDNFDYLTETGLAGILTPTKGGVTRLRELLDGYEKITTMYFSVNPDWYPTEALPKEYDVSFFGKSAIYREEALTELFTIPSKERTDLKFIATTDNSFDWGNAHNMPVHFDKFTTISRQSKINLSVTRKPFASTYASSISRPFELAAMKCAIVSNPCAGLEEWFTERKEILIAETSKDAMELYNWLIGCPGVALEMGEHAHEKVLQKHTCELRVKELLTPLVIGVSK